MPCGNLYAQVVERSIALSSEKGRTGLIVPLSLVCTNRMAELRELVLSRSTWLACYDMRPASLFEGEAQRLCIALTSPPRQNPPSLLAAGYRRWTVEERDHLMTTTAYVPVTPTSDKRGPAPKLSTVIEGSLLSKIASSTVHSACDNAAPPIYVHRIVRYFVKALDFLPVFMDSTGDKGKSDDYKAFRFAQADQDAVVSLLNSTLFYWFWRSHGDGFHCGYGDVYLMPYRRPTEESLLQDLGVLRQQLMTNLRSCSKRKSIYTKAGAIQYEEFYPKLSKSIIDEIDRVLAKHYGFTDEELDFIINYDVKYRMGLIAENGEDL